MNPLTVETSLVAALTASAFPSTPIYPGTGYQELTPESINLIAGVQQLEHVVGNLYKANVDIKIDSPALLGSSQLSALVTALETLRTNLTSEYLTAHWPTSEASFAGIWQQETAMSQHEHSWVAEVKVIIGVTE